MVSYGSWWLTLLNSSGRQDWDRDGGRDAMGPRINGDWRMDLIDVFPLGRIATFYLTCSNAS